MSDRPFDLADSLPTPRPTRREALLLGAAAAVIFACGRDASGAAPAKEKTDPMFRRTATAPAADPTATFEIWSVDQKKMVPTHPVVKTAEEWQKQLTADQFRILRQQGTERAFTGALWDNHATGVYRCAGCAADLFTSATKFESGTGWPSFWAPVAKANVETSTDSSLFMVRTEVHCRRCGGHLGHVFPDGPAPTGLRYCMNSASLTFEARPASALPPPQDV